MKRFFNIKLVFGLIVGFLLLTIQCTKFHQIKFITKSNFILDASGHEFDVIAREGYFLNVIAINDEKMDRVIPPPFYLYKDSIIHFDHFDVIYTYQNNQEYSIEVIGEWFNLKKNECDSPETHISIDENNGYSERKLTINIHNDLGRNEINIRQQKK